MVSVQMHQLFLEIVLFGFFPRAHAMIFLTMPNSRLKLLGLTIYDRLTAAKMQNPTSTNSVTDVISNV